MDEKISIDFWVQLMRLLGFELLIMVFENEDLYVLKLEHKILYTFYFMAMGNLIQHYKQNGVNDKFITIYYLNKL